MLNIEKNKINCYVILAGIILLAFVIRIYNLLPDGLWFDELQAVTHAALPLNKLIASIDRYVPHPPLYFIQLHFWMFFSKNDIWLVFNSVLWSVLTVGSIFFTVRRVFATPTALFASFLFAIQPYAVFYAQEVRMYSLLMMLGVWVWYFNYQFLNDRPSLTNICGVFAATMAYLHTHGSGFIMLIAIYVYSFLIILKNNTARRTILIWLVLHVVILQLYVPEIIHIYNKKYYLGDSYILNPANFLSTLWILCCGFISPSEKYVELLTIGILVIILFFGMVRYRQSITFIFSFIIVPTLACMLLSVTITPIWFHRSLAFTVPFLCISVAIPFTCHDFLNEQNKFQSKKILTLSAVFIVCFMCYNLYVQQMNYSRHANAKAVANYIKSQYKNGDMVIIDNFRYFWGICWYLGGPGSVKDTADDIFHYRDNELTIVTTSNKLINELKADKEYWLIKSAHVFFYFDKMVEKYQSVSRYKIGSIQIAKIRPIERKKLN